MVYIYNGSGLTAFSFIFFFFSFFEDTHTKKRERILSYFLLKKKKKSSSLSRGRLVQVGRRGGTITLKR
jgi:hypothetical protein